MTPPIANDELALHLPNSFHFDHYTRSSGPFGSLFSVTPHNLTGVGHNPQIHVKFCYGLKLHFAPDVFADLLLAGQVALAALPYLPEIHDAIGVGDDV